MEDITIIYYTANTEKENFENKIKENILKQTNLPIISVSREPIEIGKNICVGKGEVSYLNSWRQLLRGLKEAKTRFCLAAESDVLYPPEYFTFTPPTDNNVYRYTNVWVCFQGKGGFWQKPWSEGLQICGREYWIERLEYALNSSSEPGTVVRNIFDTKDKYFWTGNPAITFKTREGINYKTGFIHGRKTKLPYWGTVKEVYKKMLIN
jgi:hypothetical protein